MNEASMTLGQMMRSPAWWISVVAVGLVIGLIAHVAGTLLSRRVDHWLANFSAKAKQRSAAADKDREQTITTFVLVPSLRAIAIVNAAVMAILLSSGWVMFLSMLGLRAILTVRAASVDYMILGIFPLLMLATVVAAAYLSKRFALIVEAFRRMAREEVEALELVASRKRDH
jgi:hypothetical protein